jgi:hypothetical protein
MCGRDALQSNINNAHRLAASGKIDSLASGRPRALKRSYVFHSPADDTVREQSGKANVTFLADFIGSSPSVSWGNPTDGSDQATALSHRTEGMSRVGSVVVKPPLSANAALKTMPGGCFMRFTKVTRCSMPASA